MEKKRAIQLAFSYHQQYPILRTASAAGCDVYVLGRPSAYGLQESNHCKVYRNIETDILTGKMEVVRAICPTIGEDNK
jgi:hypothetical protein